MKKILIFSLAYNPFIGGAEIALKEITDRIDTIQFDMITLRFDSTLPRYERIGNIDVYRIGFGKKNPTSTELLQFPLYVNKVLYPVLAFFKAISLYRKNHYDALWAMMSYMGFPIVFFRMFYKKVPYILTLQEGDPIPQITGRRRIRVVYYFFKKVFTDASVVQAISSFLLNFSRTMGFRGEGVVIPNGVDLKKFEIRRSKSEIDELRKILGIKDDEKVLITTSRLVPKNAVGDVIKSLVSLPKHTQFIIVGDGPDRALLGALAEREGVSDRVKFLGNVSYQEIPKYLAVSDIFIRPSLSEGLGNSFIEAMAARVPVIATPVGGIVDFLFDPDTNQEKEPTGLFCEVENPLSIAKKVMMLLHRNFRSTETFMREKIVYNAEKLVHEQYDWNLIAENMKREVFDYVLLSELSHSHKND